MNYFNPSKIPGKFWSKVKKTSTCWIWIGNKANFGYGYAFIFYKRYRAHRISWEMANGKIPNGKKVLHRCDNPACVRPSHLFIGTQADNVRDMWRKGRGKVPGLRGKAWHAVDRNLPIGARWHRLHGC